MKPWLAFAISVPLLFAQTPADPALAVVQEAGQSGLIRAGSPLEIALRSGDLLFAGDRVRSGADGAVVWFCPTLQVSRLNPRTEVSIEPGQVRVTTGAIQSQQPAAFCPAPGITRQTLLKAAFVGEAISRDRGVESTTDELATLNATARAAFDAEMERISRSPGSDPAITAAARAAVYRRYGLHEAAANSFRELQGQWNGIDWPRQLVHEEHEELGRGVPAESALGGTGKTYALLAGISDYPLLKSDQRLQFADRDADLMFNYLRSPRGGAVPEENIRLLRNGRATLSGIRNGIAEFLRAKATAADTVILFIAAHGVATNDGAYILADDSDPDNLRDTGLNMIEIQELLEGSLEHVGHVLIFVDVCRSGLIGNIATRNFSRLLQVLGRFSGGETFGMLASAPDERSVESERFGGGHGAFSYFLSRALNGDADADGDRRVTVNELQAYVYGMVRQATRNSQNPRVTGDMPGERVLIPDLRPTGIEIADWHNADVVAQGRSVPGAEPAQNFVRPQTELEAQFEQALRAERLLPPEPGNALDVLNLIRRTMPRGSLALLTIENRLRVALQNSGQRVLLKYLRGEEVPQQGEDFSAGARFFAAALSLDSEALGWQSREWFCEARAMLFENRYQEARQLLERAVRLEPEGPYLYNALGLLYLQQADFQTAASAFREAIRFAPYWSYPRHNLALTLTQAGDYDRAILAYKEAQRVAPQAWFVAYNLGLLYQRLHQFREAEKMFRNASAFSPGRPEPYTALGSVAASRGRRGDAEKFYRQALGQQASFLPARHNLAVALDEGGRTSEAIQVWEEVLRADPRYLASRLALANALVEQRRYPEALDQYDKALEQDSESSRTRLDLGHTLLLAGQPARAEANAREILAGNSGNAAAWDVLGDALEAQHRTAEAVTAYQQTLRLGGAELRKRVSAKLKRTGRSLP